ncbi:MAG: glycosyltransferase family 1 protein [Gemmataceae bacterium]|nr:glycosyltransferase family 1 protein [Gemmataceae bacterium]
MNLVHLTSSTFFGGPERQMLGLAETLPESVRTTFVSFAEGGRCGAFLAEVRRHGFEAVGLRNDFPRVIATVRELTAVLRAVGCDVLLCHGYKADVLGRVAARRVGIPAAAVSRGWTGENRKVRAYEWLDRRALALMDHVVCVSDGQAEKVRRWCKVPARDLTVIRNSARLGAFATAPHDARAKLLGFFPADRAVSRVVLAAGRLSPEKGFAYLIEAAASVFRDDPGAGVVLFGEGVMRPDLERRIADLGLAGRFVMPGFRTDLDSLTPGADVMVLPSFTEGLPNVLLEASAAGVPVVATAVGGSPEVVADRVSGYLIPPGQSAPLAAKLAELLRDAALRKQMGEAGRARMRTMFTFEAQAAAYLKLLARLVPASPAGEGQPVSPAEVAA